MAWVHLVTVFALIEFFAFAWAVGKARQRFGIKAPATSGNEVFERYFRVQQNTLEMLIMFVPVLWMAAQYFDGLYVAAIGAVYLVGRFIYFKSYVADPSKRTLGFGTSFVPIVVLAVMVLYGIVRSLMAGH